MLRNPRLSARAAQRGPATQGYRVTPPTTPYHAVHVSPAPSHVSSRSQTLATWPATHLVSWSCCLPACLSISIRVGGRGCTIYVYIYIYITISCGTLLNNMPTDWTRHSGQVTLRFVVVLLSRQLSVLIPSHPQAHITSRA